MTEDEINILLRAAGIKPGDLWGTRPKTKLDALKGTYMSTELDNLLSLDDLKSGWTSRAHQEQAFHLRHRQDHPWPRPRRRRPTQTQGRD